MSVAAQNNWSHNEMLTKKRKEKKSFIDLKYFSKVSIYERSLKNLGGQLDLCV